MKKLTSFLLRAIPRKRLQLFSHFALKLARVFFIGNKVECTVCEKRYRKFLPYGRLKAARDQALCPNCLALERHRLIWFYLKKETGFFTDEFKMLHIAPEYCFIKRFEKQKNIDYITGDLESPLAMVKMDVHDIPFEDHTFDVLFCNHVLEHVDDDLKVMGEFRRVLKPGGWAILQSPQDFSRATTYEDPRITDPKEREKHFGQDDHVRMYGRDYDKRLEQGGFTVDLFDPQEKYDKEELERYKFMPGEKLYIARNI